MVGLDDNELMIWQIQGDVQLLQTLTNDFKTFDSDDNGTCIMFLNEKCRELDFHAIEWDCDTTAYDALNYPDEDDVEEE